MSCAACAAEAASTSSAAATRVEVRTPRAEEERNADASATFIDSLWRKTVRRMVTQRVSRAAGGQRVPKGRVKAKKSGPSRAAFVAGPPCEGRRLHHRL